MNTSNEMIDLAGYPATSQIVGAVISAWPEHEKFLVKSFRQRDESLMKFTEENAGLVLRIITHHGSSMESFCDDYRCLGEQFIEEELYFRRNDKYRLGSFEEAMKEVYLNTAFMARYMNFLLLTQVLWDNHSRTLYHFSFRYLPQLKNQCRHLELGPGHGLLLYHAAACHSIQMLEGWDVSPTSIMLTEQCLQTIHAKKPVGLKVQNLFDISDTQMKYDSVVLAEILEHLEDPEAALLKVKSCMSEGGMLWVNVPVNSPAPDHIYLLRSPEEAVELIEKAGFDIVDTAFFPMAGVSLDYARRQRVTVSVVVVGQKTG